MAEPFRNFENHHVCLLHSCSNNCESHSAFAKTFAAAAKQSSRSSGVRSSRRIHKANAPSAAEMQQQRRCGAKRSRSG
eukprot:3052802-Rhodomonas_salina.1